VGRTSPALIVTGRIQAADGASSLVATELEPLPLAIPTTSRNFQ
jgi:hypothetical protein